VFSTKVVSKTQTTLSSTFTNLKTPIVFWKPNFWKTSDFFQDLLSKYIESNFFDQEKQVSATMPSKTQNTQTAHM
jgi:hypothetical protein